VFVLPVVWGSKVFTSTPTRYNRVVVHAGDTVWSLVARRTGNGDDLGEAVYQVSQMNHLKPNSRLEPGSVLLLPKP
jgi:predicted Zn-dependent protease